MNKTQLKDLIIDPTLMEMGAEYCSPFAVELLLGTAAQESHLGEYIAQLGDGPALGIYQMEPATYYDIWENFIWYREPVMQMIKRVSGGSFGSQTIPAPGRGDGKTRVITPPEPFRMVYDLKFATVMARLHYYRVRDPLPTDKDGYAHYWKDHYNTELGKGTVAEFLHNFARFC